MSASDDLNAQVNALRTIVDQTEVKATTIKQQVSDLTSQVNALQSQLATANTDATIQQAAADIATQVTRLSGLLP